MDIRELIPKTDLRGGTRAGICNPRRLPSVGVVITGARTDIGRGSSNNQVFVVDRANSRASTACRTDERDLAERLRIAGRGETIADQTDRCIAAGCRIIDKSISKAFVEVLDVL